MFVKRGMAKEILVYIHNQNFVIYTKIKLCHLQEMSTTGNNYIRQIQSVSERQMCHVFSNLWVLDFTEIHRIWMLKVPDVFEQKHIYEKNHLKWLIKYILN